MTNMVWIRSVAVLAFLVVFTSGKQSWKRNRLTIKARKLPNDICGIPSEFGYKIFNGTHAAEGAYPWVVAIGYAKGSGNTDWFCGGTLITDQYVVTAAHCVDPKKNITPNMLRIRLADLNLDDSGDDNNSTETKEVKKVVVHPEYYRNTINDIALIRLKGKVVFDMLKKPLCLPSLEFNQNRFVNESAMLTGSGNTEYASGRVLNELAVEIKDNDFCMSHYISGSPVRNLEDRVVCASSTGKEPCNIDSGGPLMILRIDNGNPRLYLLGVVSNGYDCTNEGHPGGFVRARYFMDWIVQNLKFDAPVKVLNRNRFRTKN